VTGTLETMTDVLAKLVCKDETKERTEMRGRGVSESVSLISLNPNAVRPLQLLAHMVSSPSGDS